VHDYHTIWLQKHPNRTKEWLQERLADGFSIHHVDGNHANNSPDNLLLIEDTDHMSLHGRLGTFNFSETLRKGRTHAKARGVRFGRPPKLNPHQRQEALQRLRNGDSQSDVARTYAVDRSAICRLAQQLETPVLSKA
jgi:hypothetical protein